MLSDVASTVFDNPALLLALTVVIILAVHYQRGLTWTEYRTIHRLKTLVFPILDRRVSIRLVSAKNSPDKDREFVRSVARPASATARAIRSVGLSYHLINSIKVRPVDGGSQYSTAHFIQLHDDGTQTEVYLFEREGGQATDVYAHHETAVTDPDDHIEQTEQVDGDPRGVLDGVEWP